MKRDHDPRVEICLRCGKVWNVSRLLPEKKPGEYYICPMCHRAGEKTFVRRK